MPMGWTGTINNADTPLTEPKFCEPKAFKKQALNRTMAPPNPKPKIKQKIVKTR